MAQRTKSNQSPVLWFNPFPAFSINNQIFYTFSLVLAFLPLFGHTFCWNNPHVDCRFKVKTDNKSLIIIQRIESPKIAAQRLCFKSLWIKYWLNLLRPWKLWWFAMGRINIKPHSTINDHDQCMAYRLPQNLYRYWILAEKQRNGSEKEGWELRSERMRIICGNLEKTNRYTAFNPMEVYKQLKSSSM